MQMTSSPTSTTLRCILGAALSVALASCAATDAAPDEIDPASIDVALAESTPRDARSGSGYAKASLSSGPTWTKLNQHNLRVAKNTNYTANIWVRGTGKFRLDVVNASWTDNLASVLITATPSWRLVAVPNFNTGSHERVNFSVYDAIGGAAGTVYLDDAFLGPVGGQNVLTNPGFENGSQGWEAKGVFSIQRGGVTPTPDEQTSDPSEGPLADPDGTYFAEVDANGTGCPRGSWQTRISRDGLVFTTTFSAYEARLDPGATLSVKDCQLAIRLHTPSGRSFAVQTFSYTGFAILQRGVVGRQLASYAFQGQPVQAEAARTDLVGPYDGSFLFKDEVPLEDAVWSPCGVERDLNVTTRILLQSSSPGVSGYMNLTAADVSANLVLRLASRSCSTFGAPR